MSQSYVEKVSDTMHRLLWDNLIEEWIAGLIKTIPVLGWPVISNVFLYLVESYLVEPLFTALSRFGVFTSIDWQNDAIYTAYKAEAIKLVGAQDKDEWPEVDRKAFKDAARNLVRFHFKS